MDEDRDVVVLIHSPLVGPFTWRAVVEELDSRGIATCVPDVKGTGDTSRPFWEQHVRAIVETLSQIPTDRRLILVGHSGAGALLPSVARATPHSIASYVFVDAGIPRDGRSRLDNGPFGDYIHQLYAAGGCYPNWSDDDFREVVVDPSLRSQLLSDLRPPPLAFWEEPIPVFSGWPDAPCGYLRFVPNPAYDEPAAEARRQGWAYTELPGGHFHLLVDPQAVVTALIHLASRR